MKGSSLKPLKTIIEFLFLGFAKPENTHTCGHVPGPPQHGHASSGCALVWQLSNALPTCHMGGNRLVVASYGQVPREIVECRLSLVVQKPRP